MALLGILIGIAIWNWKPARLEAPKVVTRFAILPPPGTQLASLQNNLPESVAISPDGTRIAFTARQGASTQIYLRPIDTLESRPISGSEGGAVPFFSPDSQWVGFVVLPRNELMKAPVNGGPLVAIGTGQGNGILRWTSQETILFGGFFSPLHKIPATGGDADTIGAIEKGETGEFDPLLIPDGKNVVYVSDAGSGTGGTKIDIRSLATGERHDLIAMSGTSPQYVAPGYLVYGTGGNLMAAPFDLKRLAVAGNTVPVIQGILQANAASDAHFDISGTGTLVYVPGAHSAALKMVWVDRKGVEQPVNAPAHNYVLPRISPDGQRVTAGIEEGDDQVWTYDFGRDTLTRVTFQGKGNLDPIWTPDGKRIVFKGTGNRLFWQPADGSGTMEELTNSPLGSNNVPGSWSPDGQNMAFTYDGGGGPRQIWILPLKDRKPFRLAVNSSSYETSPRFSPDGRWMAYTSTETGRSEVYVRPYPGPGGKWQISTDGGSEPVWNPKGRELFFRSGKKMMVVEYVGQQSFTAGKPKELFEGNYIPTPRTFPDYDITPDGQKFLMLKTAEDQQSNSQINVVVNWVEELKQKVPTGKK
jgi:serine/threonine-protein kinase